MERDYELTGAHLRWWTLRLEFHERSSLPPSEVERLTLLEAVQRHAILDMIDAAAAENEEG